MAQPSEFSTADAECDQKDRGEDAVGGWPLSKALTRWETIRFITQTGDIKRDISALGKQTHQKYGHPTSITLWATGSP